MSAPTENVDVSLYAIAPTLFTSDGSVDGKSMLSNAEELRMAGIDRTLLTGSYGEFQSMDDQERVRLVREFAEAGVVERIMAGAVKLDSAATIRLCQELLAAGADEVMVAAPIAAECSDVEIAYHFEAIGREVERGLVVYNNPVFGRDLKSETLDAVASDPAYCGVKQGTSDLPRMLGTIALTRRHGGFHVFAAADLHAIGPMAAGASGLTSTNVWVFPEAFKQIVRSASSGDSGRAHDIRNALEPYARFVVQYGQPRSVKAAMVLRGYAGSAAVRLPYREMGADEIGELSDVLEIVDGALAALSVGSTSRAPSG